jgi:uncharacterized protein YjiS (DUF1127 family)
MAYVMQGLHRCLHPLALQVLCGAAYIPVIRLKPAARARRQNQKRHIMNISRSFNNWRKYRQTVTELGRMSDRELSDLGIGRNEINRVARAAIAG